MSLIRHYQTAKSNSDWYKIISTTNEIYYIEIFGANHSKRTTHCMRILDHNNQELEVFHWSDIRYIMDKYYLDNETRGYILKTSKQLREEKLAGDIRPGTLKLQQLLKNRGNRSC